MSEPNENTVNMPKQRITVSLEKELVEWLDQLVESDYLYRDRSHTIEVALDRLRSHIQAENKQ